MNAAFDWQVLLDATLPQVAFGVFWGMALAVYIFFIKGWIR